MAARTKWQQEYNDRLAAMSVHQLIMEFQSRTWDCASELSERRDGWMHSAACYALYDRLFKMGVISSLDVEAMKKEVSKP